MVASFKVFKKISPNGKITLYLGKRDFVDHLVHVDPVDGVLVIDPEYLKDRKIFCQLICSFRYGREEDEMMGLRFQKDMHLVSEQIYPPSPSLNANNSWTKLQERLCKKLGPNAYPFLFKLPHTAPASVTIQPGTEDEGKPCGIEYFLKAFTGENDGDRSHKRSTVSLGIRKIQFAPSIPNRQPCTTVRKDFMLTPGELELEVTLDKQLYHHGEKMAVNVRIRNTSSKTVTKIKAMIQQCIDVCIFSNGQYKATVAALETQEGCPISPGSSLEKIIHLMPHVGTKRGVALDGQLKSENTNLASTTLQTNPNEGDAFGIIVSYLVKIKLYYMGGLGGELVAELPFILMNPRPDDRKSIIIREDSQATVETFRQDTIDFCKPVEDPMCEEFTRMRLQSSS